MAGVGCQRQSITLAQRTSYFIIHLKIIENMGSGKRVFLSVGGLNPGGVKGGFSPQGGGMAPPLAGGFFGNPPPRARAPTGGFK